MQDALLCTNSFFANHRFHPTSNTLAPSVCVPAAAESITTIHKPQKALPEHPNASKATYKACIHQGQAAPPPFKVSQQGWRPTKNLNPARPQKKQDHQFTAPFHIICQINPVVFELQLSHTWKLHPVFHISPSNLSLTTLSQDDDLFHLPQ